MTSRISFKASVSSSRGSLSQTFFRRERATEWVAAAMATDFAGGKGAVHMVDTTGDKTWTTLTDRYQGTGQRVA
jgi:hypothetical protein